MGPGEGREVKQKGHCSLHKMEGMKACLHKMEGICYDDGKQVYALAVLYHAEYRREGKEGV